jgi:ATP-dependent Clp protease ATP-binding subunit ClpA
VVKFNAVDKKMAEQIAKKTLDKLAEKLEPKEVKLSASKSAVDYIAAKGLSETFGAREIIRVVENDVKKLLVNEILFGRLQNGGGASLVWDAKGGFKIRVRAGKEYKNGNQINRT